MRLVLIAHWIEAQALIPYLDATPHLGSEAPLWNYPAIPRLYSYSGGTLVLTDIGPSAAVAAVAKYYPGHQEIWNVGFAGALQPKVEMGTLYAVSTVGYSFPLHTSTPMTEHVWPEISLSPTGAKLITSPYPMHCNQEKQAWAERGYDLVDMEGYAIAHLAKELSVPCYLWKIISDNREQGGSSTLLQAAPQLAKRLLPLFDHSHTSKFSISVGS